MYINPSYFESKVWLHKSSIMTMLTSKKELVGPKGSEHTSAALLQAICRLTSILAQTGTVPQEGLQVSVSFPNNSPVK